MTRLVSIALLAAVALSFGGCDADDTSGPADIVDAQGADLEEADLCGEVVCQEHATCAPDTGDCVCDEGYEALGPGCVLAAAVDVVEVTDVVQGEDVPVIDVPVAEDIVEVADAGEPEDIGDEADAEDAVALPPCPLPQAPTLPVVHQGITLAFALEEGSALQVGVSTDPHAEEPDLWEDTDTVVLDEIETVAVFARATPNGCAEARFRAVYEVRESYPPAAGQEGSTAVPMDDPDIVAWATGVDEVHYGEAVDASWQTPELALGPAAGTSVDIVCLGRGGDVTLTFDPPIADGAGDDLAVFENGFSDTFLELAFVEVSSDGATFLRFDSVSLGEEAVGAFGALDPGSVGGLAGAYRQGFGTPFDLAALANRPEVRDGTVNLDAITHVRLVDIVGDGSTVDSFGHPIYDPFPTSGSAGFDLEAIAVLNQ